MVPPAPTSSRPHACLCMTLVMGSMLLVDTLLVWQCPSSRRLALCVLLCVGDLCFSIFLQYIALWVGSEVRTPRRGSSMALWFLYVLVLEVKVYFIYQGLRDERRPAAGPKALGILLSVCVPSLHLVLVAAGHMEHVGTLRKRQELRSRVLWVSVDILDLLDMQGSLWQAQRRVLPHWAEGLLFFYCYLLLVVLPCASLAEITMQGLRILPHNMLLYPLLSLFTLNLPTLLIRGGILLFLGDPRHSSIFVGKNLLALGFRAGSFLQFRGQMRDEPSPEQRSGSPVPPLHALGFQRTLGMSEEHT
ncbi:transmembrane protein 121-like [Discoglossus pictus]